MDKMADCLRRIEHIGFTIERYECPGWKKAIDVNVPWGTLTWLNFTGAGLIIVLTLILFAGYARNRFKEPTK